MYVLGAHGSWKPLLAPWVERPVENVRLCSAQGSDVQKDREVFQDWTWLFQVWSIKQSDQNAKCQIRLCVVFVFCCLAEVQVIQWFVSLIIMNSFITIMVHVWLMDIYDYPRHRTTVARLLPLCRSSVHGEPVGIPFETVESAKDWQADLIVISDISLVTTWFWILDD